MRALQELEAIVYGRPAGFCLQIDRLTIRPGRIYALTGANGAGKSTLLRLMALLEPPQSGTIRCGGERIDTEAQRHIWRRRMTLLHQSPYLFSGSVAQNIAFGLKLRGVRGGQLQERIAEALATVGLDDFARRPARQLSGGESQRVALARALALQPDLLLLDEPTAGLDRSGVPAFERLLSTLLQRGMTIVFSTHDPQQPARLQAEVIHLDAGRLTGVTRPVAP